MNYIFNMFTNHRIYWEIDFGVICTTVLFRSIPFISFHYDSIEMLQQIVVCSNMNR